MSAKSELLALAVIVLGVACDGAPTEVDESLFSPNVKGSMIIPVTMRAELFWIVDQGLRGQELCAPRPGLAVGSGSGTAGVIGAFRVVQMDHCSIDVTTVPPTVDAVGQFTLAARDGSTLHGTYEFLFAPVDEGGFFTFHITGGGRGRFAGAAGRLDAVPDVSPVVCNDPPFCLEGASWNAEFTGWIELPVGER